MSSFTISWGLTRPTRAVLWEWCGVAEGSACWSSTPRHSLAHWSSGYIALMHQAQFLTLLHMLGPFPWGVQMWAEFSLLWAPAAPLYLWPLIWCWIFYFQVFTGVFSVLAVTTHTCHLLAQAPQKLGTFLLGHFVDEATEPEGDMYGSICLWGRTIVSACWMHGWESNPPYT